MDYNASMTGASITLLHGWGMSPEVFAPLAELLGPATAFCPGLPGYPGSPWPGDADFDAQLECMARDLSGHLLGWSLGGLYAIGLALRWPDRFDRLTLLACNPCFVRRPGWDCAVDAGVFDDFSTDLAQDWQRTLRRFLALQMQGEAGARFLARRVGEQVIAAGAPDPAVLQFGLEILKNCDARKSLGRLTQPSQLVLGERDLLVPITLARQINDVAPGIRVESVAGAAHAPFLSHPDAVAALL